MVRSESFRVLAHARKRIWCHFSEMFEATNQIVEWCLLEDCEEQVLQLYCSKWCYEFNYSAPTNL